MARALIIGCHGQDGRYLWRFLRNFGYDITGIHRGGVVGASMEGFPAVDIRRADDVRRLLGAAAPDELYYLAAYHQSSEDRPVETQDLLLTSFAINTLGLVNVLAAMQTQAPAARLFYAASSHAFGYPAGPVQDETTPFNPVSPYGISKAAGIQVCRYFRSDRAVFASAGILYNHESPLRPPNFLSRKIVRAAVRISKGRQDKVSVGDLDALVDWGYAPDYVEAMWKVLQLEQPDDFIIASGALHSVRDLAQIVFELVGLDWRDFVVVDPTLVTTRPSPVLHGRIDKIRRLTGWQPTTSFRQMLEEMVESDLSHG